MLYSSFTFASMHSQFGLKQNLDLWLPDSVELVSAPELERYYRHMLRFPANTEKARSEVFVMPLLLELWRRHADVLTLFSGERIDAEPEAGLAGECDFVICARPRLFWVEAPVICVIEAKREDMQLGLTQCAAQLVGVHRFNERAGIASPVLIGCATTGVSWQFLRLREGQLLDIDPRLYNLDDLPRLLGVWRWGLSQFFDLSGEAAG